VPDNATLVHGEVSFLVPDDATLVRKDATLVCSKATLAPDDATLLLSGFLDVGLIGGEGWDVVLDEASLVPEGISIFYSWVVVLA
jgi:hypothetical protein